MEEMLMVIKEMGMMEGMKMVMEIIRYMNVWPKRWWCGKLLFKKNDFFCWKNHKMVSPRLTFIKFVFPRPCVLWFFRHKCAYICFDFYYRHKTNCTLLKGWQLKSSVKECCQILRGEGGGAPKGYNRKFLVCFFRDKSLHMLWFSWHKCAYCCDIRDNNCVFGFLLPNFSDSQVFWRPHNL